MKTKNAGARKALTVRTPPPKRRQRAKLATTRKVDRSAVITEALDQYLAFEEWQIERIKEGLRHAAGGERVAHEEVAAWIASWADARERSLPVIR